MTFGSMAQAQITPDLSLDEEISIVTPQSSQDLITGGARRGSGLFHSFEELNVGEGQSLYFSTPDNITHIFSRITGNSPSNIDGTLGVLGNADLFLLNPNGILLGPYAQLDLSGSFTASTAAGFQFEGFAFSATAPKAVPLLNVSTPFGINLGSNPGSIVNRSTANGTGLTVNPFQTLSLSGGDITLDGGLITVADGRIELISAGEILLTNQARVEANGILGNPEAEILLTADAIMLEGQSMVRSHNSSMNLGADITIEGEMLKLMNGSNIASATNGLGPGGDVTASLSEDLVLTSMDRNSQIGLSSNILAETWGPGTAGNIDLSARQLKFEYDSSIINRSHAFSTGDTGNITLNASDEIIGQFLSPRTEFGGTIVSEILGSGDGGDIKITTLSLILKDNHTVSSAAWLTGGGGDVIVTANRILLDGINPFYPEFSSSIQSIAYGSGKGGDIQIRAQETIIRNSANITTAALANRDEILAIIIAVDPIFLPLRGSPEAGLGNAGELDITADTILIDGFDPIAASRPSQVSSISIGAGDAGNVGVKARELTLRQGGAVSSSSLFSFSALGLPVENSGLGNGGELDVSADIITVTGVNSLTELPSLLGTQAGSLGNAGDTQINTRHLNIRDGGAVLSGTFTSGNGGRLTIDAQESIVVDGVNANGQPSTIAAFAAAPSELLQQAFFLPATPEGDTGQIIVNSDRLTLSDGGILSAAHEGTGNAGGLQVNVNQLLLNQGGQISAASLSGQGGNMDLEVRDILALRQDSRITTEAFGTQGNGGNLAITAGTIVAIPEENSDIIANALGGQGGNISLRTGRLLGLEVQEQLTPQSDITASSEIGLNGTVNIDLLAVDPNQGLVELPGIVLNPGQQISTDCKRNARSHFVMTGRGGLPVDPRQQLFRPTAWQDWRDGEVAGASSVLSEQRRSLSNSSSPTLSSTASPIVEAQGWQLASDGTIRITAGNTEYYSRIPDSLKNCSAFPGR